MESRLSNAGRPVRTYRDVLRTHKLTCHLSNDDEYHLPNRSHSRVVIRIHGRYRYPHQTRRRGNRKTTPRASPTIHPSYAPQIRTKRLVPETRKMRLRTKRNRLPRRYSRQWSNTDGPQEA